MILDEVRTFVIGTAVFLGAYASLILWVMVGDWIRERRSSKAGDTSEFFLPARMGRRDLMFSLMQEEARREVLRAYGMKWHGFGEPLARVDGRPEKKVTHRFDHAITVDREGRFIRLSDALERWREPLVRVWVNVHTGERKTEISHEEAKAVTEERNPIWELMVDTWKVADHSAGDAGPKKPDEDTLRDPDAAFDEWNDADA